MDDTRTDDTPPDASERTETDTAPSEEPGTGDQPQTDEPIATDEQVRTLAEGLTQNAQHHAAAAPNERAAEGDDIFSGPYDPDVAVKAMVEVNREVVAARAEWEQSKEETAGFKKTYDEAVARLSRVCSRYDALRRRSDEPQPFLKVVEADETVIVLREKLAKELAVHAQLFVDADGLEGSTREELDTLKLWATQRGPIPPELVAQKAHIAAASEDGASCLRCGAHLGRQADASDYPSEAFVGLDCVGKHVDEAVKPTRRGSKKTKQVDPDGERAAQTTDGRRRAATH
jgi:hypothetical protein